MGFAMYQPGSGFRQTNHPSRIHERLLLRCQPSVIMLTPEITVSICSILFADAQRRQVHFARRLIELAVGRVIGLTSRICCFGSSTGGREGSNLEVAQTAGSSHGRIRNPTMTIANRRCRAGPATPDPAWPGSPKASMTAASNGACIAITSRTACPEISRCAGVSGAAVKAPVPCSPPAAALRGQDVGNQRQRLRMMTRLRLCAESSRQPVLGRCSTQCWTPRGVLDDVTQDAGAAPMRPGSCAGAARPTSSWQRALPSCQSQSNASVS